MEYCFWEEAVSAAVDFELARHPHKPNSAQATAQDNASELHRAVREDRVGRINFDVSVICNSLFVEQPVIAEMVAELAVEFARSVVMEPAKSKAVIQQHSMIGHVGRVDGKRGVSAKCFP